MSRTLPWDHGITWRERIVTAATELPIDLPYVRDQFLRTANDDFENEHIDLLIRAATDAAEHDTGRALMAQTREIVLSGFPAEDILLPGPPLIAVTSFAYVDEAGDAQTLDVSPPAFQIRTSGAVAKARLLPESGGTWPTTDDVAEAVTITYTCGAEDPSQIPAVIRAGIGIMVAEMYKQRTLSVHDVHNTPSVLQLTRFWRPVRG